MITRLIIRSCRLASYVLVIVLSAHAQSITSQPAQNAEAKRAVQDSNLDVVSAAQQLATKLRDFGLSGELSLVNDWSRTLHDGSIPDASFERYTLDVRVAMDGKKSLGWNGSRASARFKHHLGDQGGDYVGDAQGFSNIDAPPRTYLYELWFEQEFMDKIRMKGGKIDANSEFATVQASADFLNSSMGYSPTILALPTYPEPQPGISVFARPKREYQVSVGVFRTAHAGAMTLAEGGRTWSISDRERDGRASFGFWHVAGPLHDFDGDVDPGSHGIYAIVEQSLWKRPRAQAAVEQQITSFFQFGQANGEVSAFTQHLGGGFVVDSPLSIRAHDALGLAATSVRLTEQNQAGFQEHRETAVEFYYKLSLHRFFWLVADAQFIQHPGGSCSEDRAVVFTPRLIISF